jgi:alanyl-tRNA synthetase
MQSLSDIRASFLEYFRAHGHTPLPSSSLVPHNDPTLMFTNAGMNQFKNIFTGLEQPPQPPRAATSQKCVRAGGKHNDLDNVGYTARHHTFFEMLGNFSFGDYFKEEAIFYAWELITKVWGLAPEKLCVTIDAGDDVAWSHWKKLTGFADHKIIRLSGNENFWAMGDTGPCGFISEIFYDHGEKIAGGPPGSKEADGDRFIEIWNLVFMQYEQKDKDTRIALPKPSIDTGMGLERITAVFQGVHDNYDIDLFKTLIAASEQESRNTRHESRVSHRVIADHLRASGFLIADGVLPGNEGRGYVLRRIMRRAMRHAHILGAKDPLMYRLVPTLVQQMGQAYPELVRAQAIITETLKLEEERFRQTLERGLKLLEEERGKLADSTHNLYSPPEGESKRSFSVSVGGTPAKIPPTKTANAVLTPPQGGSKFFPGDVAFKLYDTYGFPLDLTQDILRADAITVDLAGFESAMEAQRQRAREAHKGSGDSATNALWFTLKDKLGATEFLGYRMTEAQAIVTALVKEGKEVASLNAGESGYLLVNQTPFYAESGGQVGDSGRFTGKGTNGCITDTTRPLEAMHLHRVTVETGTLAVGDTITLTVDAARRDRIRANHSATHLLHAALRRKLGEHVTQKGSLVAEDRLRFDITHPRQITREELDSIEQEVNHLIWENSEVSTKLMTPKEAMDAGAMALFGEKYGEEVRVLTMGISSSPRTHSLPPHAPLSSLPPLAGGEGGGNLEASAGSADNVPPLTSPPPAGGIKKTLPPQAGGIKTTLPYSTELCGGTHVARTGDIGLFRILTESSVAAGIRRIEAVTQAGAFAHLAEQEKRLQQLAGELKVKPEDLNEKISALMDEKKKLEKQLQEAKKQVALGGSGGGAAELTIEPVGAVKFAHKIFGELDAKSLRELANGLQQKHADCVIALASSFEGKANIIVAVGKNTKADAPALVRAAAAAVGGQGGGGKPDFAQAGGPESDKLEAALEAVRRALS